MTTFVHSHAHVRPQHMDTQWIKMLFPSCLSMTFAPPADILIAPFTTPVLGSVSLRLIEFFLIFQ